MPDKTEDTATEEQGKGRPTKYDADLHPLLVWSYLQCGDTMEQAAEKLEVSKSTLYEWASIYSDFSDAIKSGRDKTNAEVEKTLLKRALGYTYNRIKIETDRDGHVVKKTAETVQVQPDVLAQRLWLMNRKPESWRDKHEIDLSGSVNLVLDADDDQL